MDAALIVAAAGALIGVGGITALLQAGAVNRRTLAQAREIDADAEVTLGGGWKRLVAEQRFELNEMRERISQLEEREADCKARLARLETQGTVGKEAEAHLSRLVREELERREHS